MEYGECEIGELFEITSMMTVFRKEYGKDYYYKGESHDFWEFIFVLRGGVSIAVDSHVYELQKNQMVFLKPLQFHNMSARNGENPEILIMSFRICHPVDMEKQMVTVDEKTRSQLLDLYEKAKEIFEFDEINVKRIKKGYEWKAQIFCKSLEMWILSRMEEKHAVEKPILTVCALNYSKIVDVLKNNIDQNLRIKDIARLVGMSESNVKRTFSMFANQGVMNYHQQLKIIEAQNLLKRGMAVGEVGRRLGYLEQNYFSIVFKKATGYSPKNWLKREVCKK